MNDLNDWELIKKKGKLVKKKIGGSYAIEGVVYFPFRNSKNLRHRPKRSQILATGLNPWLINGI